MSYYTASREQLIQHVENLEKKIKKNDESFENELREKQEKINRLHSELRECKEIYNSLNINILGMLRGFQFNLSTFGDANTTHRNKATLSEIYFKQIDTMIDNLLSKYNEDKYHFGIEGELPF